MYEINDKYQTEMTSSTFSFKPFHHRKKAIKWYLLSMFVGVCLTYYFIEINPTISAISAAFLLYIIGNFLKELVIYIPTKYTFDSAENAVYKSDMFSTNKKIMSLQETVIFRTAEIGAWQYKMGPKKNQFVKNYKISEFFSNDRKKKPVQYYELEVLDKITEKIKQAQPPIQTNALEWYYRS